MLRDMVAGFASVNCGKVKVAMDIGFGVCEIQPSTKRHKMLCLARALKVSNGGIRWVVVNEMGVVISPAG
jgi:hypothetical protein